MLNQTKSYCIHHFPIDSETNKISFPNQLVNGKKKITVRSYSFQAERNKKSSCRNAEAVRSNVAHNICMSYVVQLIYK